MRPMKIQSAEAWWETLAVQEHCPVESREMCQASYRAGLAEGLRSTHRLQRWVNGLAVLLALEIGLLVLLTCACAR